MACTPKNDRDTLGLSGTETGRFKAALKRRTSSLALRPMVATAGAVLASMMAATPAMAECAITPDVVCDGANGTTSLLGLSGFPSATFINGVYPSHNLGLYMESYTQPKVSFSIDATSSITANFNSAVRIASTSGSIDTTTPTRSGIDGNLISTGGFGLDASTTFPGGAISIEQGATSTISGLLGGMNVNAAAGNVNLILGGTVTSANGAGVLVNAGGTSLINTSGTISGSTFGIQATSVGSNEINVTGGSVTATNGNAIDAQIRDATASNANLLITTSAGSTITATNGYGIYANSFAGGTGTLTISNAAELRVSSGDGIYLNRHNGVGATTVTSTGSILSGPVGANTLLNGINALVTSNSELTINLTAASIGSATDRAQARGINGGNSEATSTSAININLTDASVYAVRDAVGATNMGSGGINVIGTGSGTISSTDAHAINAQSLSVGAGNIVIDVNQTLSGLAGGIYANTMGTGGVSITSRSAVTVTQGAAIVAMAGAAGTGNVTVNANGVVSGFEGIIADNAGTGNVTVNATADITATLNSGIDARLSNATNQHNNIAITVVAGTTTTGGNGPMAAGVTTDLGASDGTALVTLNGRAAGDVGVVQRSTAGNNVLEIGSTGRIEGELGVYQLSVTGTNMIINNGTIAGTTLGIVQGNTGTGSSGLVNNGTITGASGALYAPFGSNYTLTNNATGTINGSITAAGGPDSTGLFTNAGTWNAAGATIFAGAMTNRGVTNVAGDASIAVLGGITNASFGTFRFAGSAEIEGNVANFGLIDARNGAAGQIIRINGSYVGGGMVGLDASLASQSADTLIIAGTASGTTNVLVNVLDHGVLEDGFLPLIAVGSGTPAVSAFTFGPLQTTGFFLETLGVNPDNANEFGIIQTFNPTSSQLLQLSSAAGSVSVLVDEPISAIVTARSDRSTQFGVWGRGMAGDFNQDFTSSYFGGGVGQTTSDRTNTSYYILQSGLDFSLPALAGFNAHLGVTGGRYSASSKMSGGTTEIDTDFLGGYFAVTGNGLQLDATYRREWRDFALQNASLIASERTVTKGTAWAGSVNASYRLGLGGFFVKPAVGYAFGSSKIDEFSVDALTRVTPMDDKTGLLRYGGTVGWEGEVSSNLVIAPYAGVFGLHNTSNSEATDLTFASSAVPFVTRGFADAMQVVGGIDFRDPENRLGAFTRGSVYTSNGVTGASFSVGLRLNF